MGLRQQIFHNPTTTANKKIFMQMAFRRFLITGECDYDTVNHIYTIKCLKYMEDCKNCSLSLDCKNGIREMSPSQFTELSTVYPILRVSLVKRKGIKTLMLKGR